jgi:hypothetical protein
MTLKTLLLGSAAALATVGVAQAADLAVAEPVSYVKVCDAFGPGYWYSPGTQTCIRVGGYARFEAYFQNDQTVDATSFSTSNVVASTTSVLTLGTSVSNAVTLTTTGTLIVSSLSAATFATFNSNVTSDDHVFRSAQTVNVTAKSMTEFGPLTGFVEYANNTTYTGIGWRNLGLSQAYIEWGPILAGHTSTIFTYVSDFTVSGGMYVGRSRVDQVRFSWASGGFGLQLALQDYRDSANYVPSGTVPDVVGAITFKAGDIDLKVAAAWGDRANYLVTQSNGANGISGPAAPAPDTWAVLAGFGVNLPMIAAGDRFAISAGYSKNSPEWLDQGNSAAGDYGGTNSGIAFGVGSWTFIGGGFQHYWVPAKFWTSITANYFQGSDLAAGNSMLKIGAAAGYVLATNLNLGVEVIYQDRRITGFTGNTFATSTTEGITGRVRLQRNFP